jgi:hypothetical protein
MPEQKPTKVEWQRLYEAAGRFKQAALWDTVSANQVFGVQNPETGQLGFVSIVGEGGEHFAISLYLEAEGLYKFWDLRETRSSEEIKEKLVEIPYLQATFTNRRDLPNEDLKIINSLGLKLRGRHACPFFRRHRPGYAPWFLNAEEVRFLTIALEQTLEASQYLKDDDSLFDRVGTYTYFVRVRDESGKWVDEWLDVLPPEPEKVPLKINTKALHALRRWPKTDHFIEADVFLLPATVEVKGHEAPLLSYVFMAVEVDSSMVLVAQALAAEPSLSEMWSQIPSLLIEAFVQYQMKPETLAVQSPKLASYLKPLLKVIGIDLISASYLPQLEEAKAFMIRNME